MWLFITLIAIVVIVAKPIKEMKKIIPLVTLFLIIASCTNSKKQLTVRETAISLIEKEYPTDGRKLEYSQIDSTDAELKGYSIYRIYFDNDDSIRSESFHLNYNKTNVKTNQHQSTTIDVGLYKLLLIDGRIYTNDLENDAKRINRITAKYYGIDIEQQYHYRDSIADMVR